ncbi:MAG: hypothetical protein IPP31_10750 [Chitinophagaceae bacterium]|nr:hypothetical protein [Chitinophagaceae bacterium]
MILVYFFYNHNLLSQLQKPPLIYPGSDNSFWLLHMTGLPQFLLRHHMAALLFDIGLTCSCLICIFIPQQRFFSGLTVIGVWILYICFCSAAGKHYAQIGYLLAPLPFLVIKPGRFDLLWDLFRYWVCFLYVSAGLYKIWYGGFTFEGNMSQILLQGNADWFIFNRSGLQYDLIRYLIGHESIAQALFWLATLSELALVIGFFTRRFDRWLLAGLVAFHLVNLLLLHISFVEQSLIFAPFLPWHKWAGSFQTNHTDG